ncbi:MAG TPA: MFS transporter [Bacteroidetes bacterium]|nr:MFS transporter [Bacteroidota bacterium]
MKKKTLISESGNYANRWKALAVLCAAQFMVIMDTSIIGVALPAIQKALNYEANALHWIFNAYVIVFGGLLLLGGKLSDTLGPKKIFMTGFVILSLASLFTGFAWSEASMNVGRAIQGLGAALIAPSALTLLMTMFTEPKEIGKALGFWGASAAAGGSAGVFLGGVLTDFMDWRWTFFINLPIGIAVILFGSGLLLKGDKQKGKIDAFGSLLITAAISVLVYTLVTLEGSGLLSLRTLGLLAVSLLLFLVFIAIQKRSRNQLIPLVIFRAKNLVAANVITALLAAAWIPLWFFLNLYLQQILGFTAFHSGLALLPMTLAIMVLMVLFSGKIVARLGVKGALSTGLLLLSGSLVWLAFLPANSSYFVHVIWPTLLAATGMSMAYVPATIAAMSSVKPEETGIASGLVNSTYQVGSALGLALAVAVSAYVVSTQSLEIPGSGFQAAFLFAAAISLLGFLTTRLKLIK